MAAAALALSATWAKASDRIVAGYTDGTNWWGATENGKIYKYTQATGAFVSIAGRLIEGITSIAVYSTHLLVGTNKGDVFSFTLATMALEDDAPILSLDSAILSISVNSTAAIITTANGTVYNYTVS
jgi:hypothetical protein